MERGPTPAIGQHMTEQPNISRPQTLQGFIAALQNAFGARAASPAVRSMLSQTFDALARPQVAELSIGSRLPACDHLDAIAARSNGFAEDLRGLFRAFVEIEPSLVWTTRTGSVEGASETFADGHANALIVGPGGLERRTDVSIGATILAPNVRYPDHSHPPEETYIVLSPGQFSHDQQAWAEPGVGGTFYNRPGVIHAMKSGNEPLFAFWVLWANNG